MSLPKLNPINTKRGVLQIVHDFEFTPLNLGDGYTEIRDMSRDEKFEYICGRIKKLHSRGYGGIVLNSDFKNYFENEEDIEFTARVAKYAKSLGLVVWIYDEQYYASGMAGGLTLKDHPELETLALAEVVKERSIDARTPIRVASPYGHSELKYAVAIPLKDGKADYSAVIDISDQKDLSGGLCAYLPEGEWCVRCYFYRAVYDHTNTAQSYRASRRMINIMDERATRRFFDITFVKGYMKHFGGKLGDIVDAVFTDEPSHPLFEYHTSPMKKRTKYASHSIYEEDLDVVVFPYIIWSEQLPEKYAAAYGEDLITLLPHLFEETEKSKEVRNKFYTLTSKLVKEGFVDIYRKCLENEGVMLSGHYCREESPNCHPILHGDIIEHLSNFSLPGCDHLKSEPRATRYAMACKVASSASHLAGKELTMIEGSNMVDANQNITLDGLKGAVSMMFAHGINLITSYWGEDILPADEMSAFDHYTAKLSSIIEGGKYKVDTLLYYPYENLCAVTPPYEKGRSVSLDTLSMCECGKNLIASQVCFDIINKSYLLKSKICDMELLLENGEHIRRVVLPDITWADAEVSAFLNKAHAHGIEILSHSGERIEGLDFTPKKADETSVSPKELILSEKDPYMLVMQREFADYDIFMLVNSSEEKTNNIIKIRDESNSYAFVDIENYSVTKTNASIKDGYACLALDFAPLEAKLIMRYTPSEAR